MWQGFGVVVQPFDAFRVLGWVGPSRQKDHPVGSVPVGEGCVVWSDAMARPVDRVEVHRAGHLGNLGSMLDVRSDRSIRKIVDERALPVSAQTLRVEGVEGAVE